VPPRFSHLGALLVSWSVGVAIALVARPVAAEGCGELAYSFQPDCYHPNGGAACGQTLEHLDFGPQIAVWLEGADHALVDTLMVTSLTATRGIGNRPGVWSFRSGPKFPYGKRWMSLPLWAYARGQLFDAVFMQDDLETWMGFHEASSSRETYFCRPVNPSEINLAVDVVTCPSQNFNSAKGKLASTTKSYYPPRNDLTTFTSNDSDLVGGTLPSCLVSASSYAGLNDLDAVAAATPPYGQRYERTWHIPATLAPGDYAIVVEVNKEFDANASHKHPAFQDENLPTYGVDGNFGQPSVLYRVPVRLASAPAAAAVSQIAGYSQWTGDAPLDGTLLPRDSTISTTVPGSGEMRLLAFDGPGGTGRVHVAVQRCPSAGCPDGGCGPSVDGSAPDASAPDGSTETTPATCDPLPPLPGAVSSLAVVTTDATSASFSFRNASAAGEAVASYDIHYRIGAFMGDTDFLSADPGPNVTPGAPDQPAVVKVENLKPATSYVLGIRSGDHCAQHSGTAVVSFQTTAQKFTQLSGCFVATAAYGSTLEPRVAALRHARDRLRPLSPFFAAATDVYYRAGPAAAAVVARSEVARGLVRRVIAPFATLAEALDFVAPTARASR